MCDPMTAYMAFSAGASILGGMGAANSGATQQGLDNIAANNEIEAAQVNAEKLRRRGQQAKATARAAFAASGVQVDTGTSADVAQNIGTRAEEDVYQTLLEGGLTASRYRARGRMAAQEGRDKRTAGFINGGATVLGGYADSTKSGWV